MDMFDIEFYEYSMIADDPKKLEQLQNHYYDDEFDEWLEEFDREQEEKAAKQRQETPAEDAQNEQVSLPDEDTIRYAEEQRRKSKFEDLEVDTDYEISETNIDDEEWEDVD